MKRPSQNQIECLTRMVDGRRRYMYRLLEEAAA